MIIRTTILPALLLGIAAACTPTVIKDISLEAGGIPLHPADALGAMSGASTNVDLYYCDSGTNSTLIVFATGAPLSLPGNTSQPGGKEALTIFAESLAQKGYAVALAEKPNPMMGISSFLSVDFGRVIDFFTSGNQTFVDVDSIVIGGHGFGGAQV